MSRRARRCTLRTKLSAPAQRVDDAAGSPPLTIFSAPKAFQGHVGIIQENAIRSWLHLRPRPKVILFSDDAGLAAVASRLGVQLVTSVETNAHGTPLVSSMFSEADKLATSDVVASTIANLLGSLVGLVVLAPFSVAITVVLYFELRARTEGTDLEMRAQQLPPQA